MPTPRRRQLQRLLACLFLLSPAAAAAGPTVNSGGFEGPTFSLGDINGQDGWIALAAGGSTATIQSDVALTGSQALRVDRAAGSDAFWLQQISSAPTGRFVSIEWDQLVLETAANSGFGPFLGVQTFDDSSGSVLQSAGLGVDGSTGDILFQPAGSGALTESGFAVTFDEWVSFRIEIDFENNTYSGFADDIAIVLDEGFIDGPSISSISDADIVALGAGLDAASANNTGTAFFDNFLVSDGLRGDFNDDQVVSAADFTVFRDTLSQTGLGSPADGNADGVVGPTDFGVFVDDFGRSNTIGAPEVVSATAVPEPSALALGFCLLATAATSSRSRRAQAG